MSNPKTSLQIEIPKEEIDRLRGYFQATDKQFNRAVDTAIPQTINWIRKGIVDEVAPQTGLTKKFVRSRTRVDYYKNEQTGRLWIGTNAKSAHWFNNKKVTGGISAKVGKKTHFFQGAYYLGREGTSSVRYEALYKENGGANLIFYRTGEWKAPKKGRYSSKKTTRKGSRSGAKGNLLMREQVEKAVIDLNRPAFEAYRKIKPTINDELIRRLRQKLQWQTDKK